MPRVVIVAAGIGVVGFVAWQNSGDPSWLRDMEWRTILPRLMAWVGSRGAEAALWLFALQVLQVLLALPGPFFTMGAGFLLGTATGSVVAVSGSTTGAVMAYGIARFARGRRGMANAGMSDATDISDNSDTGDAAGMRVARWMSSPRLQALGRFVSAGGWRVVLSSRLIPFFPFKLSNYFFGWIRFPFAGFFWGTLLGIAPITLLSVSAGALASDLAAAGHSAPPSPLRWTLSLAMLAVAVFLLAGARRRILRGEGGKRP